MLPVHIVVLSIGIVSVSPNHHMQIQSLVDAVLVAKSGYLLLQRRSFQTHIWNSSILSISSLCSAFPSWSDGLASKNSLLCSRIRQPAAGGSKWLSMCKFCSIVFIHETMSPPTFFSLESFSLSIWLTLGQSVSKVGSTISRRIRENSRWINMQISIQQLSRIPSWIWIKWAQELSFPPLSLEAPDTCRVFVRMVWPFIAGPREQTSSSLWLQISTDQRLKLLYFQNRNQKTSQTLSVVFSMQSEMNLLRISEVAVWENALALSTPTSSKNEPFLKHPELFSWSKSLWSVVPVVFTI